MTSTDPTTTGATTTAATPSWTHLKRERRSPSYWRVTFDHPPINTITATTVIELSELVDLIERDTELNVIVFDSANPDFFLAHYDTENDPAKTAALPAGPTGMHPWLDLMSRLSRAPVVSIASIRGRARGAGSEFVLACDLRFASRENALLGQFEVGAGLVPGGGPMARLSRLAGRDARSRSCSSPTTSTEPERSNTATSIAPLPTMHSTRKSMRLRLALHDSTATRLRAQSPTSTGRHCRPTPSLPRRCLTSSSRSAAPNRSGG